MEAVIWKNGITNENQVKAIAGLRFHACLHCTANIATSHYKEGFITLYAYEDAKLTY